MLSRRSFLKMIMAGSSAAYLTSKFNPMIRAAAAISPQIPMAPSLIPQFVDALPDFDIIPDTGSQIELHMKEFDAQVLPTGMPATKAWGYLTPLQTRRDNYLGPVVVATRGQPTEMKFYNDLGGSQSTNVLAYKYGTDQTLHWADPLNGEMNMWNHMAMPPAFGDEGSKNYDGPIPAVVHLHGGEVPPQLDGGPDAWVTSGTGQYKGHGFYSMDGGAADNYHIYRYPNTQEGALIWFHDHTLGATRLNVYCGLAGAYWLLDPANDPPNLPPIIPLVIQDRMFDTAGQLLFPAATTGGILYALNPEHPYWQPEFVGDVIVVNGKTWPFKQVFQQRYHLMFINGSNARAYEMALTDPVSKNPGPILWVIGTDGGYLDAPVPVDPNALTNNKLVMMSGERYHVIVDFAGFGAGTVGPNGLPYSGNWILKNTAKTPFPGGASPQGTTVGKIMQFNVVGGPVADTSFDPAVPGATLRGGTNPGPALVRLSAANAQKTRQLTLNEVMGMPQTAIDPVTGVSTLFPGGPLEILVNNTKWSGEFINGVDDTDPTMPMYTFGTRADFTLDSQGTNYLSELPQEGETEVWEIVNLTADAHPIHTHLVQFQLLSRQNFNVGTYLAAYGLAFPGGGWDTMAGAAYPAGVYIPGFGPPLDYNLGTPGKLGGNPDVYQLNRRGRPAFMQGPARPALPQEMGWKDTVVVYPGQVTKIIVRWAPTDLPANTLPADAFFPFDPSGEEGAPGNHGYVWHCHIVDHEDNEMMRPNEVRPNLNATRSYYQGSDY